MKLGITVVYLFQDESAPLLEFHLSQIRQNTDVPYTIYAGVNRLEPRFTEMLKKRQEVSICKCPDTPYRDMKEHTHYLNHLVRAAVDDGSSHIVTLHLDSFPIRSGWAEELAVRLAGGCAIATIDRINTACLFFDRDFYLRYRPSFLLSPEEKADPRYRRYMEEHDPILHSGIGYGFAAYRNGMSWHYLKDTTPDVPGTAGRIYDRMIFHLGGAVRIGEAFSKPAGGIETPAVGRFMDGLAAAARLVTPRPVRSFLMKRFGALIEQAVDRPRLAHQAGMIRCFMRDPGKNLARLMVK